MKKSTVIAITIAAALILAVSCSADVEPQHVETVELKVMQESQPETKEEVREMLYAYELSTRSGLDTITERIVIDPSTSEASFTKKSRVYGELFSYSGSCQIEGSRLTVTTSIHEKLTVNGDGSVSIRIEGCERHLVRNEAGCYTDGHVFLSAVSLEAGGQYTLRNGMLSKGVITLEAGSLYLDGSAVFEYDTAVFSRIPL